jgi:hypothetical protein
MMTKLTVVDILGERHYRLNLAPTTGYLDTGDTIVAAPVIHTYSAGISSIISGLALQANESTITMEGQPYQVKQFLTVQRLNAMFLLDEEGPQGFMPTIKPHYAIAPHNAAGSVYSQDCKTLVKEPESSDLLMNGAMPVHAHDGRVSPPVEIKALNEQLIQAVQSNKSKFYTSYVVDEQNKQILVTEHCLLMEADHEMLFQILDMKESPTLDDLMFTETPIKNALIRFIQPVESAHLCIQAVFSGAQNMPAKAQLAAAEAVPGATAQLTFFQEGGAASSVSTPPLKGP